MVGAQEKEGDVTHSSKLPTFVRKKIRPNAHILFEFQLQHTKRQEVTIVDYLFSIRTSSAYSPCLTLRDRNSLLDSIARMQNDAVTCA